MSKTRTDTIEQADAERIAGQAEQAVAKADGVRMAAQRYNENRDLANQIIGQFRMARAIRLFADVSAIAALKFVRENKLYRHIKMADGQPFTWEEYCKSLGVSHKTVNEQILNLNTFGEEFLEAMQRMGLGYRDLRQFRRLPADERTALMEAARAGDKNELLDLAESLITKHDEEKKRLEQEKQEAEQRLQASERLLSDKDRKINELDIEIERLKGGVPEVATPGVLAEIEREKLDAVAGMMQLKARIMDMERRDGVERAEWFALRAAVETLRDEVAMMLSAVYATGQEHQFAQTMASMASDAEIDLAALPGAPTDIQ